MTASFGNLLHQLPGLQMLRSNILCCSPLIFTSSFLNFISSSKLKIRTWQNNSLNLPHLRKSRSGKANLPRWLNLADYATLPPSPDSPWPFIPYPRNPAYAAARGNRHAMPPTHSPPLLWVSWNLKISLQMENSPCVHWLLLKNDNTCCFEIAGISCPHRYSLSFIVVSHYTFDMSSTHKNFSQNISFLDRESFYASNKGSFRIRKVQFF